MLILSVAFLVFAALVHFAHMTVQVAAMLVGLGLLILAVVVGDNPFKK